MVNIFVVSFEALNSVTDYRKVVVSFCGMIYEILNTSTRRNLLQALSQINYRGADKSLTRT